MRTDQILGEKTRAAMRFLAHSAVCAAGTVQDAKHEVAHAFSEDNLRTAGATLLNVVQAVAGSVKSSGPSHG